MHAQQQVTSTTENSISENLIETTDEYENKEEEEVHKEGLSGPIDIVTEHEEEHYEDNEIEDLDEDTFIAHETEQLLSNQIAESHDQLKEEETTAAHIEEIPSEELTTAAHVEEIKIDEEEEITSHTEEASLEPVTSSEMPTVHEEEEEVIVGSAHITTTEEIPVANLNVNSEMIDNVSEMSEQSESATTTVIENEQKEEEEEERERTTTMSSEKFTETPTEQPVEIESQTERQQEHLEMENEVQSDDEIVHHSTETTLAPSTEVPIKTELPSTEIPSTSAAAPTEMPIDAATTQAILELTTRTEAIEPHAEISTTIANFIHEEIDVTTTTTTTSLPPIFDSRRELMSLFYSLPTLITLF
jgi:hypothetical protein